MRAIVVDTRSDAAGEDERREESEEDVEEDHVR